VKRSKSSRAWLDEHVHDPYVREAQAQGYRSRAAFKLLELDTRERLFRPGQVVVDLGAAPGSWSQVALTKVGGQGRVVGVDLLPIAPLPGAKFLQGDFTDPAVEREVVELLGGMQADLVLSDMAPKISGVSAADQARSAALAELALDFADRHLKREGVALVKVFQGSGFPQLVAEVRQKFRTVTLRKPKASRDRSPEQYLVARGRRGGDEGAGTKS
jgi:23S rRNA (uridine2552-2'-O)-methyltransferase